MSGEIKIMRAELEGERAKRQELEEVRATLDSSLTNARVVRLGTATLTKWVRHPASQVLERERAHALVTRSRVTELADAADARSSSDAAARHVADQRVEQRVAAVEFQAKHHKAAAKESLAAFRSEMDVVVGTLVTGTQLAVRDCGADGASTPLH
jgi:hypothetical protein